jgi:vacuolar-type H+-ATPase subunit H
MSDILEKLLGVEKDASVLVTEAEAEANRRKAAARAEAQKLYAEALKEQAARSAQRVAVERERVAAERDEKNRAYRQSIAARPLDSSALRRAVTEFIEKGSR